jgi:hypothetical protein
MDLVDIRLDPLRPLFGAGVGERARAGDRGDVDGLPAPRKGAAGVRVDADVDAELVPRPGRRGDHA